MKNILCPTDFSPISYNAITYAAKLSQVTNSQLTLLNVQSRLELSPVEFVTGKQFTLKATGERLQAQCKEISNIYKITCTAEVEAGYHKLSTAIGEKAQLYDLVVMGSNGADDLYQLLFGTHTFHAISKANRPLLLVPGGVLYSDIRTIVYAFDYLRERKLPIDPLFDFARSVNSSVNILQVMEEAYSAVAEQDLLELQFILKNKVAGKFPLTFDTIRSSAVASSIDNYIHKHQPDVLALCTRHRNFIQRVFHKSVIKDISAVCRYPLFVFHE